MSTITRKIALSLALLPSVAFTNSTYGGQENNRSQTQQVAQKTIKELKEFARKNVDAEEVPSIVVRTDYEVENIDIETVRNNRNFWFASLAYNQNYLKGRSQESIQQDIEIAIKDPDSLFATELVHNPGFKLTPELIDLVEGNHTYIKTQRVAIYDPKTNNTIRHEEIKRVLSYKSAMIAEGIGEHPQFPFTDKHIQYSKENPNSYFVAGLTQHPKFPVTKENIEFAMNLRNIDTMFAWGLTQNKKFPITKEALELANRYPDSLFTRGLIQNPNYDAAVRVLMK